MSFVSLGFERFSLPCDLHTLTHAIMKIKSIEMTSARNHTINVIALHCIAMLDADVACKLVQGFYVNAFVCLCAQPKIL